jgi:hypothetical protein
MWPLLFFVFQVFADDCLKAPLPEELNDLNAATINDTQIITEDDLRFCPGQSLKNSDITPKDLADNGTLWRVGNNRWNDEWEKKYQKWVQENLTTELFNEINLATDCADAAIAIRAIFSRLYQLPLSLGQGSFSHTSRSYQNLSTVTHWSEVNWKEDFKNDKRFKKALEDLFTKAETQTLHQDTYPIRAVNDSMKGLGSCVAPGTIKLTDGHTQILNMKENSLLPFRLLSSTVPKDIRSLEESSFVYQDGPEDHALMGDENKSTPGMGFLWWNWSVNCQGKFINVTDEDMPYYEKENPVKSLDLNLLYSETFPLGKDEKTKMIMTEIQESMNRIDKSLIKRMELVNEAFDLCTLKGIESPNDCFIQTYRDSSLTIKIDDQGASINWHDEVDYRPWSYGINSWDYSETSKMLAPKSRELFEFYDTWSTPHRDKRISDELTQILKLSQQLSYKEMTNVLLMLLERKVTLDDGTEISFYHLQQALGKSFLSFQPWDSSDKRWGLDYLKARKKELFEVAGDHYKTYQEKLSRLKDPNFRPEEKKFDQDFIDQLSGYELIIFKEMEVLEKI